MSPDEYGPFATVVAVGAALIATFSLMLVKMFGGMRKWAFLAAEDAPFLLKTGSRLLAVGAIALTYLTINRTNYLWFGGAAVVCGLIAVVLLARFDRLRKLHVRDVPLVGPNGSQTGTEKIVIGTRSTMLKDAGAAYDEARKQHGGLSLIEFMAGFGARKMYDPESCWDSELLAGLRSQLTMLLVWVTLLGVMVLYLAASSIEVANRSA